MLIGPVNAVTTTGIYCRDGCPASPDPGHVRTYVVDAAAEHAGYRPCLRCRPDRGGPPARFAGTPDLVDHALHAICNGALDSLTEHELASQLGVSGRHLRRLFSATIGVTPTQVSRSRRAHFARRLIDETDLPFAQIAFAAGFSSVRAFNTAIRQTFAFTPTELRAKRRRNAVIEADGGISLTIPAPQGAATLTPAAVAQVVIAGVEAVTKTDYRRIVVIDGHPGAIRVGWSDPSVLVIEAHLPRFDGLIELASAARRLCDNHPKALAVGWTEVETAIKRILVAGVGEAEATDIVSTVAERHGTELWPLRPLELTHANADYSRLSSRDWIDAGVPRHLATVCRRFASTVGQRPRRDRDRST